MAYTVIPTISTGDIATASWGNTHLKNNFAHILTAGGLLMHETGGLEIDISGVANGGVLVGTGSGVWAIRAGFLTAGAAGFVKHEAGGLEFDASGVTAGQIPKGSGTGSMALLEHGTGLQHLRTNSGATDIEWATVTDPLFAIKAADETVNNTTTVQDDNHLSLSVASNTTYGVELAFYAVGASSSSDGIDWRFTVPSGASMSMGEDSDTAWVDATAEVSDAYEVSSLAAKHYTGKLVTSGAAGTATMQWAQKTAHASNLTLVQGCWLRLTTA